MATRTGMIKLLDALQRLLKDENVEVERLNQVSLDAHRDGTPGYVVVDITEPEEGHFEVSARLFGRADGERDRITRIDKTNLSGTAADPQQACNQILAWLGGV
jgi:hypothetical protein